MPGPSTDVRPHVPCPETFKVLLRGIEISNGFVEASLLRVSQGNHVNASKLRFCVGYGPKLRDGTIVLPRKIKVHRVVCLDNQRQRIKLPGAFDFLKGLVEAATESKMLCIPVMPGGVVRILSYGATKFPLSGLPIPIVVLRDKCQRSVGICQAFVDSESFESRRTGFRNQLALWRNEVGRHQG
jgi:hypothetical protein